MAFIYGDPNSSGPFTTFQDKDLRVRAIKLTQANFSTTGVNTLVAALPADSSIVSMSLWNKTQLAGGGITAATISIGSASAGTQFVNTYNAFGTAGTRAGITPITGILQAYNPPYTTDIQIWINGTATTGNPTSGEMYLVIEYAR